MNAIMKLHAKDLSQNMPGSIIGDLLTCTFTEGNILLKEGLKDEDYVEFTIALGVPALVYLVGDYILVYLASNRLFYSKRLK